jgi:hypothetical protein
MGDGCDCILVLRITHQCRISGLSLVGLSRCRCDDNRQGNLAVLAHGTLVETPPDEATALR